MDNSHRKTVVVKNFNPRTKWWELKEFFGGESVVGLVKFVTFSFLFLNYSLYNLFILFGQDYRRQEHRFRQLSQRSGCKKGTQQGR